MRRSSRPVRYAAVAALALALAGCTSDGTSAGPEPAPTDTPRSSSSSSSSAPGTTTPSSPSDSPSTAQLDWRPVPGPVRDSVTTGGGWTLDVQGNGGRWSLDGPHGGSGGGRTPGFRVSDTLMDADWAVVVLQDRTEQQPSRAEVTDLRTGKGFTIDGKSDVPTTNGGTWALGDGTLLHATVSKGAYCVATVDLATRRSTLGWCAPKRTGFNGGHLAPGGTSVLSFDSGRPSCRTLVSLTGSEAKPFDGVPDCKAWDGLLTGEGAVWSVIPNEHRIEAADFFASTADGEPQDLGPGTAGSLVWCGDAAWFVRDPQEQGDPATLMRWSAADGLDVAYRTPGGRAFLSAPRCGGDAITVTAMTSRGDEQVTADLS